ncbi:hypothetical protein TL16_g00732 [Triparma laevis f. inornata]|uniref:Adenylate kinase n=1 Tax=Triparma laevis f. inornata TaxID=1714386 RepID=A0A9W6Z9Y4_9STRA|nr:hypothetical protein TL16_g00732 [Triparma laevis f. inornata]
MRENCRGTRIFNPFSECHVYKNETQRLDSCALSSARFARHSILTHTQQHFDFIHLSVGDLLRLERSNPSSANGQLIESYLSEGKIVPVSISLTLVQKKMSTYPPSTIFLIDGFPRSLDNLTGWSSQMSDSCKTLSVLIYDCPLPILESRILLRGETSGRSDDNISSLKKRFMTFKSETIPVVKMLEESGVECVHISGENTLEEVWISTKNVIEELLKAELIERNELLNSGGHLKEIVDDDILESFINQGLWKSPIGEVEVEGKRATIKGEEGRRIWELRDGEWWMIHFSCAE